MARIDLTDDPYRILGVAPNASEEEIRRAYRARTVVKHRQGVQKLSERLQKMHAAYEFLLDPERRAVHDALGDRRERVRALGEGRLEATRAALDEGERVRAEGRRLAAFSRRRAREQHLKGKAAKASHAGEMERIAAEHRARELADARRRRIRAIAGVALRVALVALLLGAAVFFLLNRV